jgi:hypothetical protein
MASKQEIEKELKIALIEIGAIKPWFDKEVKEWLNEKSHWSQVRSLMAKEKSKTA